MKFQRSTLMVMLLLLINYYYQTSDEIRNASQLVSHLKCKQHCRNNYRHHKVSIVVYTLFFLRFVLFVNVLVVRQPLCEHFFVYLVRQNFALEIPSILDDTLLLLLVKFNTQFWLFLFVISLESHAVQVETFSWSEINIVFLLFEGQFDSFLPGKFLIAYLNKQPNHLTNLMIDKALPNERKPHKTHPILISLFSSFEPFLKETVDNLILDEFCLHRHHIPIAFGIIHLVSFGEVMVIMSAEVECYKVVEFGQNLIFFQLVENLFVLEVFTIQKEFQWSDVVVHPRKGIMPHVESFPQLFDCKHPNIKGKFRIDILNNSIEIYESLLSIDDVPLIKFQTGRDAIAQGMNFLISSASSRPLYPSQILLVALQYKSIFAKHLVHNVLDGIFSVSLVLKTLKFLPVIAEEDTHLDLETLLTFPFFNCFPLHFFIMLRLFITHFLVNSTMNDSPLPNTPHQHLQTQSQPLPTSKTPPFLKRPHCIINPCTFYKTCCYAEFRNFVVQTQIDISSIAKRSNRC